MKNVVIKGSWLVANPKIFSKTRAFKCCHFLPGVVFHPTLLSHSKDIIRVNLNFFLTNNCTFLNHFMYNLYKQ